MKEWSEKEDQIKKEDEKVNLYKQLWNLFDDGDKNKKEINIFLNQIGVEFIDYFLRRDVEKYKNVRGIIFTCGFKLYKFKL